MLKIDMSSFAYLPRHRCQLQTCWAVDLEWVYVALNKTQWSLQVYRNAAKNVNFEESSQEAERFEAKVNCTHCRECDGSSEHPAVIDN